VVDGHDKGLRQQLQRLGKRSVAGWKVGLTSGGGRDSMGIGFRPFGFILNDRCLQSGDSLQLAELPGIEVETELCFRFKADLPLNASADEVKDSISSVAPAFEIIQMRLGRDTTVSDRLADGLSHWGIVVGMEHVLDWRNFDFSELVAVLSCNGTQVETQAAAGHIDDHFHSMAALSATLARFDRRVLAGNRVITGSYTRQCVRGKGIWRGDFGEVLGGVDIKFI